MKFKIGDLVKRFYCSNKFCLYINSVFHYDAKPEDIYKVLKVNKYTITLLCIKNNQNIGGWLPDTFKLVSAQSIKIDGEEYV